MKEYFNPFNQPVSWLVYSCLVGLISGFSFDFNLYFLFLLTALFFLASILFYWISVKNLHPVIVFFRNSFLLTSFSFLVAGYTYSATTHKSLRFPDHDIRLKGTFTSIDRKPGYRGTAVFFADSVKGSRNWISGEFKLLFFTDSILTPIIREGVGFELDAKVILPEEPDNFGEFNYREYLESNHIAALVLPENIYWIKPDNRCGSVITQWLGEIRFWIELQISRFIPTRDGQGFVRGLLLGYRSWLPEESVKAYSVTGTLHILSVSGLHVGFVTLLLFSPWVRLRYWFPVYGEMLRIIFTLTGLVLYGWLTGWSPSMVRAVLMSAVVLLSILKKGKSTGWSSLFFAFILMIAYDPVQAGQPGFLLSFGAVAGLLFADRVFPGQSGYGILEKLISPLKLTVFALLATAPVTILFFHNLPVTGALANLIIIPATSVVMITGFLSVLVSPISGYLASVFGSAASFTVYLMQEITLWFSKLPASGLTVSFESTQALIIVAGVLATLILYGITLRKVVLYTGGLIILLAVYFQSEKEHPALVSFMSCGQGDLCWIFSPDGHLTLIDGGPVKKSGRPVSDLISNRLKYWGKTQIDLVIITHPHLDHYGGLSALSTELPVKTLLLGDTSGASALFHQTIRNFKKRGSDIQFTRAKTEFTFGPKEKLFLIDPENLTKNMNEKSFLIRYQFYDFSLVTAGDLETPVEELLTTQVPSEWFKSTVTKVSHHGSKTSSGKAWMEKTESEFAVISAGVNNRYRLPVKEIEEKWIEDGSHLLETQKSGEIRFLSTGKDLSVVTKKNGGNQKSRGDKI